MKHLWKRLFILCNILLVACLFFCHAFAASTYEWPTDVHTLSRGFANHANKAIDIAAPYGSTVVASREGTVYRAYTGCNNHRGMKNGSCSSKGLCSPNANTYGGYCNNQFGNGVIIKHSDGTYAHYGHMATVNVYEGQWVGQGTVIGTSGDSGYCTGACLHFELRSANPSAWKGSPINPEYVLGKEPCTSHIKGKYLWCETLHPHYNYFVCANCGQNFTDGTTDTIPSCALCNGNTAVTNQPTNTTPENPTPSVSFNAITEKSITESTARVSASCSYKGTRPSEVGLYLGTSSDNMSFYKNDVINHKKNPFDVWYNLSGLEAGQTYYYYFYATVNGEKILTMTQSFKTAGNQPVQNLPAQDTSAPSTSTSDTRSSYSFSNLRAKNVTQSTAHLTVTCKYKGNPPTKVGLYLGKVMGNQNDYISSTVNPTSNPFEISFDVTGLDAKQMYYYQFYADNENRGRYRSNMLGFITKAEDSPTTQSTPKPSTPEPSTPTTSSNTRTGYVVNTNEDYLAINDGPAASPSRSNQIGRIPPDGSVTVYPDRTSGNWYWVEYNGVSGYVYKNFISFSRSTGSTSNPNASTSVNTRTGVVSNTNGEYLAINDGPAASPAKSNQIGRIPPGGAVTVYPDRTSGNWYWVEYNGVSGYVYKKFITLQ